jgi:hypothetical protein
MSILSKALKKLRPVGKILGGGLDVVSDFLPPGLSAVGNTTAKLMQNKNLKSSMIGAGKDMAMGKIGGFVAGKLGGAAGKVARKMPGGVLNGTTGNISGGVPIPDVDVSGALQTAGRVADKYATGSDFASKLASSIGPKLGAGAMGAVETAFNPNASTGRTSTATRTGNGSGGASILDKILGHPGLLEAGAGLAGTVISGAAQGAMADKDRAWEKDKFGVEQAPGLQRDIESAPIRDKAMYLLTQRMGMQPESFTPHDIFNPSYGFGPAKLGGYDDTELSRQNAAYTPGAGGVKTDLQKELLKKLGYGQKPVAAGR